LPKLSLNREHILTKLVFMGFVGLFILDWGWNGDVSLRFSKIWL